MSNSNSLHPVSTLIRLYRNRYLRFTIRFSPLFVCVTAQLDKYKPKGADLPKNTPVEDKSENDFDSGLDDIEDKEEQEDEDTKIGRKRRTKNKRKKEEDEDDD